MRRLLFHCVVLALLVACSGSGGGADTNTGTDIKIHDDVPSADLGTDTGTSDVNAPLDLPVTDPGTDNSTNDTNLPFDVPMTELGTDSSTQDTSVPADAPVDDQGSNDPGCTAMCTGKECGDDGCGGTCGECDGATPYCKEGTCVPECAAESAIVEGWVKNSVNDMDFTGELVDVQLFHKLDIDEWEDGCISKYFISMSKLGLGCEFSVQMETDQEGHLDVTDAVLKADSFCPNWSDADEGEYHLQESSLVVCSNVEVTAYMVASTCIPNVSLEFSGQLTLARLSDGKILNVDLSGLQVVGDMISTGDTELTCPNLCAGKECGDDGCGGSCGLCTTWPNSFCDSGTCNCLEECEGKECGDDGCGQNCGTCSVGQGCNYMGLCDDFPDNGDGTITDMSTGLVWQKNWGGEMKLGDAKTYCQYNDAGLPGSGWHLPNISELRSLIRGCPSCEIGGDCGVLDLCPKCGVYQSCLTWSSCRDTTCDGCPMNSGPGANGCYWDEEMEGECDMCWSSSILQDTDKQAWYVLFKNGSVINGYISDHQYKVRCVR